MSLKRERGKFLSSGELWGQGHLPEVLQGRYLTGGKGGEMALHVKV